jgi:hypothetical protein
MPENSSLYEDHPIYETAFSVHQEWSLKSLRHNGIPTKDINILRDIANNQCSVSHDGQQSELFQVKAARSKSGKDSLVPLLLHLERKGLSK